MWSIFQIQLLQEKLKYIEIIFFIYQLAEMQNYGNIYLGCT